MSFETKLNNVLNHYAELKNKMAESASNAESFVQYSKEFSDLTPYVDAINEFYKTKKNIEDLELSLINDSDDESFIELVKEELEALKKQLIEQEFNIRVLLLPKDLMDEKNAILEVRAGTGGDEAGLFAADLFRMYQRYAESQKWKFDPLYVNENELGGIREAAANIIGKGVFSKLKFEKGVHRVQRVPTTESSGRIHTSTATVAVLPEAEEIDIHIDDKDLKIDVMRASGAGGQHVNKTESAVRITHIPSGIVVFQQDERSQHMNKMRALKILRARLFDAEQERASSERAANRKSQVGTGERSERIRTYNFPQGRITDHRIGLTLYKIELIINGPGLAELTEALIAADQEERLQEFTEN